VDQDSNLLWDSDSRRDLSCMESSDDDQMLQRSRYNESEKEQLRKKFRTPRSLQLFLQTVAGGAAKQQYQRWCGVERSKLPNQAPEALATIVRPLSSRNKCCS
jgi:hypothetical protein